MNIKTLCTLALTLAVPAAAADWSGPYVGVSAGYGMAKGQTSHVWGFAGTAIPDPADADDAYDVVKARSQGGLLGFQAGWMTQQGSLVFGAEVDFTFGQSFRGSNTIAFRDDEGAVLEGAYIHTKQQVNWTANLVAKVGLPLNDTFMPYILAGVAKASVKNQGMADFDNYSTNVIWNYPATKKQKPNGFVFGGGVEWRFQKQISAKLEYQRYEMGKTTSGWAGHVNEYGPDPESPWAVQFTWKNSMDQIRLGVNYRF